MRSIGVFKMENKEPGQSGITRISKACKYPFFTYFNAKLTIQATLAESERRDAI
jgi:hypothetical protein